MDNLTHTLVGLMLSRAGLNRLVPCATTLLVAAANIPDIDVVSIAFGPAAYLHYHRGITHALAALPFMAVFPVLLIWLLVRKRIDWVRAWLVSLLGVSTHPLLDYTNLYGVRWFLPFSPEWRSLDITNVVDLWIWAALALALVAPAISRLVSSEIGAAQTPARGWAVFALLFVLVFNTTRFVLHARAVALESGRIYNGATPRKVAALPHAFNPMQWRGLIDTDEFFVTQQMNLTRNFDPAEGRIFYKPERHPGMEAVSRTEVFRDLLAFSPFVLWQSTPEPDVPGATRVEAIDLRFGEPPKPGFAAAAVVNEQARVIRSWFHF
jgi:inner membrane protein